MHNSAIQSEWTSNNKTFLFCFLLDLPESNHTQKHPKGDIFNDSYEQKPASLSKSSNTTIEVPKEDRAAHELDTRPPCNKIISDVKDMRASSSPQSKKTKDVETTQGKDVLELKRKENTTPQENVFCPIMPRDETSDKSKDVIRVNSDFTFHTKRTGAGSSIIPTSNESWLTSKPQMRPKDVATLDLSTRASSNDYRFHGEKNDYIKIDSDYSFHVQTSNCKKDKATD